ncbi:hypothetical protein WICPIJ_008459 [Wickerhamomyces pijperi]|uniref:Uncharacterized protein n=1 Tax=Wickerhamomyces pijperi TaxID=599730 RepID=A0A9P8THP5_WICPI|nr:hypothetical protein WICPIJ_008459 [Wickerhamomyces pijperi]
MKTGDLHVCHDLLRFDFVGDVSPVVGTSFKESCTCEMLGPTCDQCDVDLLAEYTDIGLIDEAVDDRLEPIVDFLLLCFLQFADDCDWLNECLVPDEHLLSPIRELVRFLQPERLLLLFENVPLKSVGYVVSVAEVEGLRHVQGPENRQYPLVNLMNPNRLNPTLSLLSGVVSVTDSLSLLNAVRSLVISDLVYIWSSSINLTLDSWFDAALDRLILMILKMVSRPLLPTMNIPVSVNPLSLSLSYCSLSSISSIDSELSW